MTKVAFTRFAVRAGGVNGLVSGDVGGTATEPLDEPLAGLEISCFASGGFMSSEGGVVSVEVDDDFQVDPIL